MLRHSVFRRAGTVSPIMFVCRPEQLLESGAAFRHMAFSVEGCLVLAGRAERDAANADGFLFESRVCFELHDFRQPVRIQFSISIGVSSLPVRQWAHH